MDQHKDIFKWVSVQDDMPFYGRDVLVKTSNNSLFVAYLEKCGEAKDFVCTEDDDVVVQNVVAWSYIPPFEAKEDMKKVKKC